MSKKKKSKDVDLTELFPEEPEAQLQCHCGSAASGPLKFIEKFMKQHRHEKGAPGFRP